MRADGSPGPLERNTQSGLSFSIASTEVSAGTTVTLNPWWRSFKKMERLAPKSKAAT